VSNGNAMVCGYVNSYLYCGWTCSSEVYYRSCGGSNNVVPRWIYPGGVFVPVCYCWGHWELPAPFRSAVQAGTKDAGDILDPVTETCTVGVDCSGLVSRVWGLSTKHGTSNLAEHATKLSGTTPLSSLLWGDVFNLSGVHVLIFSSRVDSSYFNAFESTTRNSVDGVVYWQRGRAELIGAGYSMLRYKYWTG
jgi:hypothetical protein